MLTTLSEFDKTIVPSFEDFNNVITFKNNNITLINSIKAITQVESNSIRFPKFGYNYEYIIDINIPFNTADPTIIITNPDIKNIFFYNKLLSIGYKLIHIKTHLMETAINQQLEISVFHFEFNIDVRSCDMLSEDDSFLIRTLLLRHI